MASITTVGFSFLTAIFTPDWTEGYHDLSHVQARWAEDAVISLDRALAHGGLRQALETAEYNAAAAYDDGCGWGAEVYEAAADAIRVALGREAERAFQAAAAACRAYVSPLPEALNRAIGDWEDGTSQELPRATVAQARENLRASRLWADKVRAWTDLLACGRALQPCEEGDLEQAEFWLGRAEEFLRLTERRVRQEARERRARPLTHRPFEALKDCRAVVRPAYEII